MTSDLKCKCGMIFEEKDGGLVYIAGEFRRQCPNCGGTDLERV